MHGVEDQKLRETGESLPAPGAQLSIEEVALPLRNNSTVTTMARPVAEFRAVVAFHAAQGVAGPAT